MPPKREQIAVACAECQKAKAKCDGARPTCQRCQSRGTTCYYDVEAGTSRSVANKRKRVELQNGVDDLLELYEYLRSRPDPEVVEIIRRIRVTEDPFAVVRLVRDGDILLQRRLSSPPMEPILRRFDADALQYSQVKVPARPWTCIAGDGIVSHLLSMSFNREQHFTMPFIHKQAFLKDMVTQSPDTANFCSPMLVNAICAMGTFGSSYAQAIDATSGDSARKLGEQFFNEAKKLFDKETGKASLATTQALFFLYMYSSCSAMDRAGLVFRLAGCEMYKRLKLGSKIPTKFQGNEEDLYKEAVSRAAWGMFCCETLVSFAYLQVPLIAPPTIRKHFVDGLGVSEHADTHLLGSDNVLDAQASSSEIFYQIASNRPAGADDLGSPVDLKERERLYGLISGWHDTLPARSDYVPSQFRQWHYLRCHYHFVAILIYRPLQDLDNEVSNLLGTPAEICIKHCVLMVRELEDCKGVCPSDFSHGSNESLFFFYVCLFTLITILDKDVRCQETFTKCCQFFYNVSNVWPAAKAMLAGARAMSRQLGLDLPQESSTYLPEPKEMQDSRGDVPISWVIPQHSDLLDLLSDNGSSTDQIGVELGTIISKWSSLSI